MFEKLTQEDADTMDSPPIIDSSLKECKRNSTFEREYGILSAQNILYGTKFVISDYGPLSYLPPAYMDDFPILPRRWEQIYLPVYFWPQKRSQVGMSLSRMQRGTPALPPGATSTSQPAMESSFRLHAGSEVNWLGDEGDVKH